MRWNKMNNEDRIFRFDHTKLFEGAEFYEMIYGYPTKFRVVSPVTLKDSSSGEQIEWEAVKLSDVNQEKVHFLVTKAYEHYGPIIYLLDEIVERNGVMFTTR